MHLTDATTTAPVTGAVIQLTDGAYTATMFEGQNGTYQGGNERAGTYRVDVTAAGYEAYSLEGVVAPQGTCGPVTQELEIALQPRTQPALLLSEDGRGGWAVVPGRLVAR